MPGVSIEAATSGVRVLIYVQHLLGTGHLRRSALLAQGLAAAGMRVELISGGLPAPHLPHPVVQLPPVRCAAGDFTLLLDEAGSPVSDAWRSRRRRCLLNRFAAYQPHALIVETFPFGRRQMDFELVPLIKNAAAAEPRPVVVSSVRDVLQKRRPQRVMEAASLLNEYFDKVLVHGDPSFIGFDETFPMADDIRDKIVYTGYIAEGVRTDQPQGTDGENEVLVSAGGGAVSKHLMSTALQARRLSALSTHRWRFLVGPGLSARDIRELEAHAERDVIVESVRSDFADLLRRCKVSVSQGGYNTVVDVLRAGARAVIVPFSRGGETEQTFRAGRLHERGYAWVVDEAALTPKSLAAAIDRASLMKSAEAPIDMNGAANSARQIAAALA